MLALSELATAVAIRATTTMRAAAPLGPFRGDAGAPSAGLRPVHRGVEAADLKAAKALLATLQELGVGVARTAPCADRA